MTEKLSSEEPILSSEEPTKPSTGSRADQPINAATQVCSKANNWIELKYLYCDGKGVAGAHYRVINNEDETVVAQGQLDANGYALCSLPLGVDDVSYSFDKDPPTVDYLKKPPADEPRQPIKQGWFDRITQGIADAGSWTWGVVAGDFNENQTVGQVAANTVITMIPGVDQAGDVRDIAANLKFLIWDKRYDEKDVWIALVLTLIGLVPTVGSAAKGVLKTVARSLKTSSKAPLKLLIEVLNWAHKGNAIKWLRKLIDDLPGYAVRVQGQFTDILKNLQDKLVLLAKILPSSLRRQTEDAVTVINKVIDLAERKIKDAVEDLRNGLKKSLDESVDFNKKGTTRVKDTNIRQQEFAEPSDFQVPESKKKVKDTNPPSPSPEPKPGQPATAPSPEPKPEQPVTAPSSKADQPGKNAKGESTQVCSSTSTGGCPISMVTGEELLSLDDFVWDGPLPFIWTRFYRTAQSATDGPLGYGWLTPLDEWLEVSAEDVAYHDSEGRTVKLPLPELGGYSLNLPEHLRLYRERGGFRLVSENRPDRIFAGEIGHCRLSRWRNEYGHSIELIYDSAGQVIALATSWGKALVIQRQDRRIVAIGPGRWGENGYEPTAEPFVRYQYDDQSDLISVVDRLDQGERYAYREHMIVQRTFASGFNVYFEWDVYTPHGRCLHNWGDDGIYDYRFEWADNRISRAIDSRGGVTEYQHNANALLLQQISPEGRTTRYVYNDSNLLQNLIDPAGHITTYEYDDEGQLTAVINPLGQISQITYSKAGKPLTLTDPVGQVWARTYDRQGRLTQTRDPQGNATRFGYNGQGLLATVTNVLGQTRTLLWDEQSRLVGDIGFDGVRQHYQYDTEDRIVAVVTQDQRRSQYQYDPLGRVIAVEAPDGGVVKLQYNAMGLLTHYTDALGRTTEYRYADGLSQVTERIHPDGQVLRYEYDSERNLVGLINAKGERYSLSYDKDENLVQEVGFDGRDQRYQYDISGNLRAYAQRSESAWQVTRFQRDPLGQLLLKRGADGNTAEFTYDPLGRLVTATNDHAHLQFAYNPLGQVIQEIQNDAVVQHEYNAIGQRITTITPDSQHIGYVYDAQNRLQQVSLNGQPLTQHRFDALGQEIARQQGSLISWYDYDPMGRLVRHQSGLAGRRTAVLGRSYRYDTTGNLTAVDDFRQGQTQYLYDPADRLIQVDGLQPERFVHDPAGNLIGKDQESCGLVKGDRLILLGDRHFTYDAAGNLVEERRGKGQKIISRYVYDSDNRLIRSETPKGIVRYGYDALGRRIVKETEQGKTHFVYDGARLFAEIEGERRRTYLFEPGGFRPLARIDCQGLKAEHTVYYYHLDHLGTPKEMTNAQGQIVWSARYRAYGALALADVEQIDNPLRFQGQYFDAETGLHYNLNRYYDPASGRFIHQDPIGLEGGDNLYQYAPNPVNWIDPFGLTAKDCNGGVEGEPKIVKHPSERAARRAAEREAGMGKHGGREKLPDQPLRPGSRAPEGDPGVRTEVRSTDTGRTVHHDPYGHKAGKIPPHYGVDGPTDTTHHTYPTQHDPLKNR